MFIGTLELFKCGIGPSSSHTMGPMYAAADFLQQVQTYLAEQSQSQALYLSCTLKGSLAYTGKGHGSDTAVALGLHGYTPIALIDQQVDVLLEEIYQQQQVKICGFLVNFDPKQQIVFDYEAPLSEHPNGMIFQLCDEQQKVLISQTYFSIGGGFICTIENIHQSLETQECERDCPYPFTSAKAMIQMSRDSSLSVAQMKYANELCQQDEAVFNQALELIWHSMKTCVENGLQAEGILPGGLEISRRAKNLHQQLSTADDVNSNDWLCAYAMAVNEENAAGHMVVTAPTNGAAGVIPAVLYYGYRHQAWSLSQIREFLLTAAAIGGLVKYRSSISGAEVGCQGEVGVASAMAAAGLCAVNGGSTQQIENAAEIALEHHLGMTCDPVKGLVQVPCIERNGFGAIKATAAASLAIRGDGEHFMPLDNCIAAMKQTGEEMSDKLKETSLGGLAVSFTEC